MNIYEIYTERNKIDISQNLRMSRDAPYVMSIEEKLLQAEKELGEECVICAWGYPLPHGKIEGYGIHTRQEADKILTFQREHKGATIFLNPNYFDKEWFKQKRKRLREKPEIWNGQIVYKNDAEYSIS